MLSLLPSGHKACFFLPGAFLKRFPADVRSNLVHDNTLDPLTLALGANKIHQSRVSSPPPSTTSIPPQKVVPFLLSELLPFPVAIPSFLQPLVLALPVHLLLLPSQAIQIHLISASIIKITVTRLRNVELLVPGRETSCPAGGRLHPTCRFNRNFSSLNSRQTFFLTFSCGLRCLCLSLSGTIFHLYLWCEASNS